MLALFVGAFLVTAPLAIAQGPPPGRGPPLVPPGAPLGGLPGPGDGEAPLVPPGNPLSPGNPAGRLPVERDDVLALVPSDACEGESVRVVVPGVVVLRLPPGCDEDDVEDPEEGSGDPLEGLVPSDLAGLFPGADGGNGTNESSMFPLPGLLPVPGPDVGGTNGTNESGALPVPTVPGLPGDEAPAPGADAVTCGLFPDGRVVLVPGRVVIVIGNCDSDADGTDGEGGDGNGFDWIPALP